MVQEGILYFMQDASFPAIQAWRRNWIQSRREEAIRSEAEAQFARILRRDTAALEAKHRELVDMTAEETMQRIGALEALEVEAQAQRELMAREKEEQIATSQDELEAALLSLQDAELKLRSLPCPYVVISNGSVHV